MRDDLCSRYLATAAAALVPWAAVPIAAAPAHAAGPGIPCVAEWDIAIVPGLGLTPTTGTYGTTGENGIVTCDGDLDGHPVSGPGSWGVSGTYGTATEPDDCLGVHGPIAFTFTIPTAAGSVHAITRGVFDYGLRYGRSPTGGRMNTPRASGTFTFTPTQGNCLIEPLRAGHLRLDLVLSG